MHESTIAAPPAEIRTVTRADLAASLRAGWRDLTQAPLFGLFFSLVYVAGGWLLWWALTTAGQLWWTIPVTLGFPLLGPFIAVGFYEISRRIEVGAPLDWGAVLGVIFRQKDRQIPSIAAVVVVFFLFWNFLAHMIFALFMGLQVMTNISSSYEAFLTPHGLAMITMGTAVGAVFSAVLFSMTVVALPMLLDREVDFVTAMLTSLAVVRQSPAVMLGWGMLIAVLLFVAMLPAFLGLFLVLPLLGHASWHLYRRALG
ncbi:Uncharacterized membrane protein [Gemmobacter megaterium]|uniref:Uncharacterized membrane protein n=1 Tax=Gemmobacter megaterium TaxID=1086013 RepID=A0A1N7JRS4_9RHOB|nr:DUF2189 domain-containing protein [Gemmobacter megaterium]GGD98807.1 membrane protein [Gemmobacter megaterium]SIS52007.1 Uncharacterized membrane protein [Gemmobacter megaterium]